MFSKLREKDDSFKKSVAIFFAGFFSMGLLVVWVQQNFFETKAVATETKEKGSAFFSQFGEQMSGAFVGFKHIVGEVKDFTSAIITNTDILKEEKKSDTIVPASTTDTVHTSSHN